MGRGESGVGRGWRTTIILVEVIILETSTAIALVVTKARGRSTGIVGTVLETTTEGAVEGKTKTCRGGRPGAGVHGIGGRIDPGGTEARLVPPPLTTDSARSATRSLCIVRIV